MDRLSLTLQPRAVTGKKVKHLRTSGFVPASVCGRGITPENYVVDAKIFAKVYQQAGRSTLIELQTPNGMQSAFIREVQRHPISKTWLHADFRIVDLRVPITADVPVTLVGHNPLVDRGEGVSTIILQALHVRALPGDLPAHIEVDISGIEDFNTVVHVSDLQLGDKVEVLTAAEEPVATLTPSTTSADDEAITEQEELGEPELVGDETAGRTNDDDET